MTFHDFHASSENRLLVSTVTHPFLRFALRLPQHAEESTFVEPTQKLCQYSRSLRAPRPCTSTPFKVSEVCNGETCPNLYVNASATIRASPRRDLHCYLRSLARDWCSHPCSHPSDSVASDLWLVGPQLAYIGLVHSLSGLTLLRCRQLRCLVPGDVRSYVFVQRHAKRRHGRLCDRGSEWYCPGNCGRQWNFCSLVHTIGE